MFTGLVDGMGEIVGITAHASEKRFTVSPDFVMENIQDGESIAINGVCLSVEKHTSERFQVYASRETLRTSNLGQLTYGSRVNLERALAFGERLGGHLVSGHVDCVASVRKIEAAGLSMRVVFSFPARFAAEVIVKGSVALDGVSLTVNACGPDFLEVNIIPDSLVRANIGNWNVGTKVNMETDLIGKYVLKALETRFADGAYKKTEGLTSDFLARHGFI